MMGVNIIFLVGVFVILLIGVVAAVLAVCLKKVNAQEPVSYTHLDVYKRQE